MKFSSILKPVSTIINAIIICCVILALFYFNYRPDTNPVPAIKGIIDLSGWDFHKSGMVNLSGEWEFYDGQLLTPADFKKIPLRQTLRPGYIQVPFPWKGRENPTTRSDKGVGTYRLMVLLKPTPETFGLKIASIRMAHRLYINGRLSGTSGVPALMSSGKYLPGNTPYSTFFTVNGDRLEIIIQNANYTFFNGGIINPVHLGLQHDISRFELVKSSLELAIIIVLLLFGAYHLSVFLVRRRDRGFFYTGLYFLLLAILIAGTGEKLFMQAFPMLPFEFSYRFLDFAVFLSVVILASFIRELGRSFVTSSMVRVVHGVILPFLVAILFTPYYYYSLLKNYFYLFIMLFIAVLLLRLIWSYFRGDYGSLEKSGLRLLIISIACLLYYVIEATLYVNNTVPTDALGKAAFFGFIIAMALLIAHRFAGAYNNMELMAERLTRIDQMKDDFLAKTSHELRTPLNGIINISTAMLEEAETERSGQSLEQVRMINRISRRLANLVNDLLDLARIKNGEIRLDITTVEVRESAAIICEVFRYITREKKIALINNIAQGSWVRADQNRFYQILYNLIDNAVKHTPQGSITLDSYHKGNMLIITVEDTGAGIPADKFETIFESFEQAFPSQAENHGGLGLGLFISRQLAELMDGRIYLDWSEEGVGSRFIIALPLAASPGEVAPVKQAVITAETPIQEAAGPESPGKVAPGPEKLSRFDTVIIADDDLSAIEAVRNALRSDPYQILTAFSGEEALQKLKAHPADLVLLDVNMPGISGFDVCRQIRKDHSMTEVPVLFITGRNTPRDIQEGFKAGANDFIAKPFNPNELRARVKTLITMKQSAKEAFDNEMAFLQAQIKPHFLYNTISTIISFCHIDHQKAAELLLDFSNYLRLAFDTDNTGALVPLAKEIDLVKAYVAIETARFGDKFSLEYQVDESAYSFQIPPLIIQPLVENAIRHGLYQKKSGGRIRITIFENEGLLEITVSDNGDGMMMEKTVNVAQHQPNSGIGISNIQRRLARYPGAVMQINSIPKKGTTVNIRFPCIQKQPGGGDNTNA